MTQQSPSSFPSGSGLMAKDVMNPHAVPLTPGKFERDLVVQFLSGQYDGWPVVDPNRKVIGVARELLLLDALSQENVFDTLRVEDAMSTPPFYVFEHDPVNTVLDLMIQKQVLRIPVVGDRCLVGVISRNQVLRQSLVSRSDPSRLISVCPWCERIQESNRSGSDATDWQEFSSFLSRHGLKFTDVDLAHAYCTSCFNALQAILTDSSESGAGRGGQTPRQPSVLVVDDDASVLGMVCEALKEWGYDVCMARNGREGLNAVEAHPPDGILLDLHMPVMNGRTMLDELRWLGYRMPVVMISGGADHKELQQFRKEGAQGFLVKPFSLARLKHLCEQFFVTNPEREHSHDRYHVA